MKIDFAKQITRRSTWTPLDVRTACVENYLYSEGTNEEYERMLQAIEKVQDPSDYMIYAVAKDIAEHSENQTITNVMFILANEAIKTTFMIDGRDDI